MCWHWVAAGKGNDLLSMSDVMLSSTHCTESMGLGMNPRFYANDHTLYKCCEKNNYRRIKLACAAFEN